jgi:hypothetical protein
VKTKALSQDLIIQRCLLILLDLVHMLILVSKAIFLSVSTTVVAIHSGTGTQLVRGGLLSYYGGGSTEEVINGRRRG